MTRQDAEKIITEYLKPIYGFALKRCKNLADAEDMSQEIVMRAFRALLARDDIADTDKFIWTVAHNTLANYYRDSTRMIVGVPIDDMVEIISDGSDLAENIEDAETVDRLHREIAYLSKLQRQIVIAYYYENLRQSDIAEMLGIPLGTVKWHLFEAKKELKRGMDTVRNSSELKFNPKKFSAIYFSGSVGEKGSPSNFLRSALAQNIVYAVRNVAKTVNEIADALGVSPVYVENEIEFLEEYGIVLKKGDKYICNIIVEEATEELLRLQDEMYLRAADIIANELYDELTQSGILDDPGILGGITGDFTFTYTPPKDKNYMLWALIPYIAATSGEELFDEEESIIFDEVATIRPDGGKNIIHTAVEVHGVKSAMYSDSMSKQCGPCWGGLSEKRILWLIDTEWSTKRITPTHNIDVYHDMSIIERHLNCDGLIPDEYAYLTEKGYISMIHEPYDKVVEENPSLKCPDGSNKCLYKIGGEAVGANVVISREDGCVLSYLRPLYLSDQETKRKLLAIGDRIKAKHWDELKSLRRPYIDAVLAMTPEHLRKMQMFELQYIFFSDGWFILHCLKNLVNSGKLKEPTEEQRKSLSMLIIEND